jgi:2-keto-4-pentenoate hydratase/2-oxohepta-3-ene-1,7-dioic acid hydratase in catechol pathway
MRVASFNDDRVGLIEDDLVMDVTPYVAERGRSSPMRQLIEQWHTIPFGRLAGERLPLGDVRLGPPVPDPSKIFAAPVNYRDHQAEMSTDTQVDGLGLFLKAPSSITGTGGTVLLPYHDRRFDHEGELACVIGKRARRVDESEALEYVFGYTTLLDMTMRGGEDRSTRKSFETFTPMGPWIVTSDEFGAPDAAELRCWVNSVIRQEANVRDLIWNVAQLVSYASWVTTLEPGDIITTGTPAGVGPVADGDVVEVEVTGIGGRLRVAVSAAGAVASHTTGHGKGPVPPPPPVRG